MADEQPTRPVSHARTLVPVILLLTEQDANYMAEVTNPAAEFLRRVMSDAPRARDWTLSGWSAEMLAQGQLVANVLDMMRAGDLEFTAGRS